MIIHHAKKYAKETTRHAKLHVYLRYLCGVLDGMFLVGLVKLEGVSDHPLPLEVAAGTIP